VNEIVMYRDIPWYYAKLLDWHIENGVVKAFPKKPLSQEAHKWILRAFYKWGGKFVSHNGVAYYELVLEPRTSMSTPVAEKIRRAYEELQKETQK